MVRALSLHLLPAAPRRPSRDLVRGRRGELQARRPRAPEVVRLLRGGQAGLLHELRHPSPLHVHAVAGRGARDEGEPPRQDGHPPQSPRPLRSTREVVPVRGFAAPAGRPRFRGGGRAHPAPRAGGAVSALRTRREVARAWASAAGPPSSASVELTLDTTGGGLDVRFTAPRQRPAALERAAAAVLGESSERLPEGLRDRLAVEAGEVRSSLYGGEGEVPLFSRG